MSADDERAREEALLVQAVLADARSRAEAVAGACRRARSSGSACRAESTRARADRGVLAYLERRPAQRVRPNTLFLAQTVRSATQGACTRRLDARPSSAPLC